MDFMFSVVLPLFISFGQFLIVSNEEIVDRLSYKQISVTNGQIWGSWGHRQMCPLGTYATGFNLKVEDSQGIGDDTALNGIALYCTKPIGSTPDIQSYSTIQSDVSSWGTWGTEKIWCTHGVLQAFQLRVEPAKHGGDDTAVNNIRFKCTGNAVVTGKGMSWGEWGEWSETCPGTGICGIQTKVEVPQHTGDDTALNDVIFNCCA